MLNLYLALLAAVFWGLAYGWYFVGTNRVEDFFTRLGRRLRKRER